jgi:hypothetical protein
LNFFVSACAVSSFLKAPNWTEQNDLPGGWDADFEEIEVGFPGGVGGRDVAGLGVSATFFPGGNCDFDPAPDATVVTGDAGTGVSAGVFPGGNCDFDPAPGAAAVAGDAGAGASVTVFPGGNCDFGSDPGGWVVTGDAGAGVSTTIPGGN